VNASKLNAHKAHDIYARLIGQGKKNADSPDLEEIRFVGDFLAELGRVLPDEDRYKAGREPLYLEPVYPAERVRGHRMGYKKGKLPDRLGTPAVKSKWEGMVVEGGGE
jgi:hypothetical protein